MSKMGISTVTSYRGAQAFEAIGLSQELIDSYFTGTTSQLGGIGLDVIAEEVAARHASAYPLDSVRLPHRKLQVAGSTNGDVRASRTSSTQTLSSGCSTPPGHGATTSSSSTRAESTSSHSG